MQNPFTTTFSKTPEYTYISSEKTDEILENFNYEHPSESVYKITGVRGSGKTVLLAKIEEELRDEKYSKQGWFVFDLNPNRDMLMQMAAMLVKSNFGKDKAKGKSVNISANILGTGAGFGVSSENGNVFFDIGVEIEQMLEDVAKKKKKILIGIDEVSKNNEMIGFASEFGKWLRANYPVYLVCTGLYENIMEVSNVKNLTFFRRATTIKTEPLNMIKMSEMYRRKLGIEVELSIKMAKITKGYAYAFQELGVLYFKKKNEETLDDIIPEFKSQLFSYSYEKIWEELTDNDRLLLKALIDSDENKRENILQILDDKAPNYSMYRDRLLKRGIIKSRQAYISLALPYFADFIKDYCCM